MGTDANTGKIIGIGSSPECLTAQTRPGEAIYTPAVSVSAISIQAQLRSHFSLDFAGVIRVWFAHEFVQMLHVILYPDSDLAPLQPQVAIPVLRRLKSTNILFLVAGVSHVDR